MSGNQYLDLHHGHREPAKSLSGGLVVSMLASGIQNPQHAFLRNGSKAICPMSQICGMSKNPITHRGSLKL
jgi:hypothetical protein